MRAEQLGPWVKPDAKKMLAEENRHFKLSHDVVTTAGEMLRDYMTTAQMAYREATLASMELSHKFRIAFLYGYLALEEDAIGDEGARTALLQEIAEYLRLVEADIDSFVATHPIRAIEKEEKA